MCVPIMIAIVPGISHLILSHHENEPSLKATFFFFLSFLVVFILKLKYDFGVPSIIFIPCEHISSGNRRMGVISLLTWIYDGVRKIIVCLKIKFSFIFLTLSWKIWENNKSSCVVYFFFFFVVGVRCWSLTIPDLVGFEAASTLGSASIHCKQIQFKTFFFHAKF